MTGGVIAKGTVTRVAGSRIGFQDFRTASRDFGVAV
jgi:streptogrisin D